MSKRIMQQYKKYKMYGGTTTLDNEDHLKIHKRYKPLLSVSENILILAQESILVIAYILDIITGVDVNEDITSLAIITTEYYKSLTILISNNWDQLKNTYKKKIDNFENTTYSPDETDQKKFLNDMFNLINGYKILITYIIEMIVLDNDEISKFDDINDSNYRYAIQNKKYYQSKIDEYFKDRVIESGLIFDDFKKSHKSIQNTLTYLNNIFYDITLEMLHHVIFIGKFISTLTLKRTPTLTYKTPNNISLQDMISSLLSMMQYIKALKYPKYQQLGKQINTIYTEYINKKIPGIISEPNYDPDFTNFKFNHVDDYDYNTFPTSWPCEEFKSGTKYESYTNTIIQELSQITPHPAYVDDVSFINYVDTDYNLMTYTVNKKCYVINWKQSYNISSISAIISLNIIFKQYSDIKIDNVKGDYYPMEILYIICNYICCTEKFNNNGNNIDSYHNAIKSIHEDIKQYLTEDSINDKSSSDVKIIPYTDILNNVIQNNYSYRNLLFYPSQLYFNIHIKYILKTNHAKVTYTPLNSIKTLGLITITDKTLLKLYDEIIDEIKMDDPKKSSDYDIELCIIYESGFEGNVFINAPQNYISTNANYNNTSFDVNNNPIIDGKTCPLDKKILPITYYTTLREYYYVLNAYNMINNMDFTDFQNELCNIISSNQDECIALLVTALNLQPGSPQTDWVYIANKFNNMGRDDIQNTIENTNSITILLIIVYILKFQIVKSTEHIFKIEKLDMWINRFDNITKESIKQNDNLMYMLQLMITKVPLNLINNCNDIKFKNYGAQINFKHQSLSDRHSLLLKRSNSFGGSYKLSKFNTNLKSSINHQLYNIINDINKNSLFIKNFNKQLGGGKNDFLDNLELEMDKYLIISNKLEPLINMSLPLTSEEINKLNEGINLVKSNEKTIKEIIKIFLYYKNLKTPTDVLNYQLPNDFNIKDDNDRSKLYIKLKNKLVETKDITTKILNDFKKLVS